MLANKGNSLKNKGEILILLPGFSMNGKGMEPLTLACGEVINALCMEYPSALESPGAGIEDLVDYFVRKVRRDRIEKVHLLGISFGGFVAQVWSHKYPEMVCSLTLLGTTGVGPDFKHPVPFTNENLEALAALPLEERAEVKRERTVHPSLKEKNPKRYREILDLRLAENTTLTDQKMQNNWALGFLNSKTEYRFHGKDVFLGFAKEDRMIGHENLNAFKSRYPEATSLSLADADHFFFMEKLEELSLGLRKFYKGLGDKHGN